MMFDTLFGEGQYALKMLFAFIVVFGLLALALWLVRRFGGERLGSGATRGRQPRLAVIDAATVDSRRRLVLIRRDNVEHLLMIGGPTDLVVEPNIFRVAAAQRETASPRPQPASDGLPRAVPLGESGTWPLQPEAALRPEPPPRPDMAQRPHRAPPVVEEPVQWSPPESEPAPLPLPARERRVRTDPLAGLAEELSRAPAATEPDQPEQAARPAPRREPRLWPQSTPSPAPAPAAGPKVTPSPDQNLAYVAQRLEAALRRPAKSEDIRPAPPPGQSEVGSAEAVEVTQSSPASPHVRAAAPMGSEKPARSDGRPWRGDSNPAPQKSLYDSLEQEMASLLGRPDNKR